MAKLKRRIQIPTRFKIRSQSSLLVGEGILPILRAFAIHIRCFPTSKNEAAFLMLYQLWFKMASFLLGVILIFSLF